MPSVKNTKPSSLISNTGLWDEGIGYVFLGVAALMSWGFASSSGISAFFTISWFAALETFFIASYAIIGVGFIVAGYYLHSVQGKLTKAALIVSAVLSIIAIINIIPIIPAVLSIYALIKSRGTKRYMSSKKPSRPFDVRDYPALSIMVIMLIIIGASAVRVVINAHQASKSTASTSTSASANPDASKLPTAKCSAGSTASSCIVAEPAEGFKVTFMGAPDIRSSQYKGGNPVSSFDQNTMVTNKQYQYAYTNGKIDNGYVGRIYYLSVSDYGTPLPADPNEAATVQQTRLENGLNGFIGFCETSKQADPWTTGRLTTYQSLPADSVTLRDGKGYNDRPCSLDAISILKGTKVYSLEMMGDPAEPDASAFNAFLQSFSLTQ